MRGEEHASNGALVAELNDLLQLDRDALPVYGLALACVADGETRRMLSAFEADHRRHIEELEKLVAAYGGAAASWPHMPTGFMKLGAQALGAFGGQTGALLALRSNERQVKDKYARHCDRTHPENVTAVLNRIADDESRHYEGVCEALQRLGVPRDGWISRSVGALATGQKLTADAVERLQRATLGAPRLFRAGQAGASAARQDARASRAGHEPKSGDAPPERPAAGGSRKKPAKRSARRGARRRAKRAR